jgi:peroxiredoxin Q/BCP
MEVNDKSPDFSTTDENGKEVALKDFRGQTVVLYFYPKADTSGCTKEACGFRDSYKEIKKTGVVLLVRKTQPPRKRSFSRNSVCPFRYWPIPRKISRTYSE